MTDKKPLRVALYSRVSTKDKGQVVHNQTDQLREFCERQNWQIVKEYTDHAPGKRGDRVKFAELFDAASRREFDAVLFWALDRFTREGTLPTLQYLQRLESYGVAYRSFAESWLDSLGPFKDVVLALLATLAKQEKVRLSERVTAGLARARKGGRVGGRPKFVVSTNKIRKLADQGLSAVEIGTRLGCSRMTVARRLAEEQGLTLLWSRAAGIPAMDETLWGLSAVEGRLPVHFAQSDQYVGAQSWRRLLAPFGGATLLPARVLAFVDTLLQLPGPSGSEETVWAKVRMCSSCWKKGG